MKKIIVLLTIIMLMLNGCSSAGTVDEDKVKDVSDKITKAIINSVGKENAEKQETIIFNSKILNRLNIKSSVGNIFIEASDSDDATIDIKITSKSDTSEKAKKIIENFDYSIKEIFNTIEINTKQDNMRIFEDESLKTDLKIFIPENIENLSIELNVGEINIKSIDGNFFIQNNVGNTEINDSAGTYNIESNVGKIIMKGCKITDTAKLKTNTGNINATLSDISDAKEITAETDVGNIELSAPDNSNYIANINELMGGRVEMKGNKGTKIELRTSVGNINFK